MVFIYYGEEIGMHDVEVPPELAHDPQAVAGYGRDPQRTPMQWSAEKHAGFTTGPDTWLPVALDYKTHNVEAQSSDPNSMLSLYRQLGALRARSPAFTRGRLKVIKTYLKDVLGYLRYTDTEAYLVLVNFSEREQMCHLLSPGLSVDISSRPDSQVAPGTEEITLAAREAVVLAVRPEACSEWP
jgi:alpha-glucosidase